MLLRFGMCHENQQFTFCFDVVCLQEHKTYCVKHDQDCTVHKGRGSLSDCYRHSLVVNSAGNCCQAWSQEGKRAGAGHGSMHALNVWIAVRRELARQGQESIFFQECTPLFQLHRCLVAPLQSTHHMVYATTGPRLHGWPAARERKLSAGLSLRELVWVGPSSPEAIQEEFDCLFGRRCEVSGKVFFQAREEDVRQMIDKVMRKRMRVSHEVPLTGPRMWAQVLTPAQMSRVREYEGLRDDRSGLDGCFIADVDHWPNSPGPACGAHFPTLLRHGTILEFSTGRIAMPQDRWLSLGFNVRPDLCPGHHVWPAASFVGALSSRVQHCLSGNSQSLPAILAWKLYVFANTVRRETPTPCAPPVCLSDVSEDEHAA